MSKLSLSQLKYILHDKKTTYTLYNRNMFVMYNIVHVKLLVSRKTGSQMTSHCFAPSALLILILFHFDDPSYCIISCSLYLFLNLFLTCNWQKLLAQMLCTLYMLYGMMRYKCCHQSDFRWLIMSYVFIVNIWKYLSYILSLRWVFLRNKS